MKSTESETAHCQVGIKWLAWNRETEKISEIFSSFSHKKDESMNSENLKVCVPECVPQVLGTTKFTNLIGWNGYWPRSRLVTFCSEKVVKKNKNLSKSLIRKKVNLRMSTLWQILVQLITFCKQNVSQCKLVTLKELSFSCLPYNL